jgi:putative spermidine/putrescine transport system substrate-binding protein
MRRVPVVLSLLACVIAVAACGSSAGGGATSSGGSTASSSGGSAATSSGASATGKYKGVTLKVANCCGVWDKATSAGVDKRFEQLTGAKIAYTEAYPEEAAPSIITAHAQNPPYDVLFDDDETQTELAKLGLLDKYNPATLTEAKQVPLPPLNAGYPPGAWLYYIGFAYNYKKFQQLGIPAPTSWSDLFNPKLAGHVSIPALSTPQGFQTVAAAAKVAGASQYDLAAGIKQLAKLKLYNVYSSSSQYQTDLSNGNTWLAVVADGRAWQLVDAGVPVHFVVPTLPGSDKKAYYAREYVDILTGTPHRQLADIYQQLASDAVTQASVALGAGYSPTLQSAYDQVVAKQPKWGQRWPKISTVQSQFLTLNWSSVLPQLQSTTNLFARDIGNGS